VTARPSAGVCDDVAMDIRGVGIWSAELRRHEDEAAANEAAAELEELGYTALWFPGGQGGPVLDVARRLLGATRRVPVATGILNVWMHDPAEVARERAALAEAHPGRFLLGVGIGHRSAVDAKFDPGTYRKPLSTMRAYLDALDAATPPVAPEDRALAALGPKMLELARDRSAGAHPYFVGVEHTRAARAALGDGPLLAPEQAVVLETDPETARAIARTHTERYLRLPNYTNNLLRHGLTEDDIRDAGSDRLIDTVVAWGDVATIKARIDEHVAAGADHVCVQVITGRPDELPLPEWRELAAAL
jgi:probable F420-dependent oxidoreductase